MRQAPTQGNRTQSQRGRQTEGGDTGQASAKSTATGQNSTKAHQAGAQNIAAGLAWVFKTLPVELPLQQGGEKRADKNAANQPGSKARRHGA